MAKVEHLPDGGAIVTFEEPAVWTALDVFTWVAFGERREGSWLPTVLFPQAEWSREWRHWPPESLVEAFKEAWTGVPWEPDPGSYETALADENREWARQIISQTGESPRALAWLLASDVRLYRRIEAEYRNAKAEVMTAICDGRLPVWARKAHGQGKPNYDAEPERLNSRLFTHEPREVDEGGWVSGPGNYKGPWWDQVRFDAEQVRAIWPMGEGIAAYAPPPCPFPQAERIAPWVAASWRAFGTLDVPEHIARHRSFDGGTQRPPDETKARHAARLDEHKRFDAAERELLDLLASGRVKARGQPPADGAPDEPKPGSHVDVPAGTFLDEQLAFDPGGELIVRLPVLERAFPPMRLRGTEASSEHPLWFDLLIEAAGLREAWGIGGAGGLALAPETTSARPDVMAWMMQNAETFLRERRAKAKRADLLQRCVQELKCSYDEAEAAYASLPPHLRRKRGEHG